jgi:hypothetical protein
MSAVKANRRRRVCRLILSIGLIAVLGVGCQNTSPQNYPSDPLLASKQPVIGKLVRTPSTQNAYFEPGLPPLPDGKSAKISMPVFVENDQNQTSLARADAGPEQRTESSGQKSRGLPRS